MRRIVLSLLSVALVFSLSACSAEKDFVLAPFSSDVTFSMGDVTVRGKLNFATADDITFTVSEPDYVSGIVFTRDEVSADDIKISYGKVADSSPMRILLDVIADVSLCEVTIPLKGEYTYSGETSSAGYKIIFDCENDRITNIEAGKFTYIFE